MTRARHVLQLIDEALHTYERNPTLWAAQLRNDRDCLQLARAVAAIKVRQPASKARPDRDEVERVDRTYEEQQAREAEEHDRGRRLRFGNERRGQRDRMDPLNLHRQLIERVVTISTVPASQIAPSRPGGDTHGGVPRQQTLDDDPRYVEGQRRLRKWLLTLHDLVDEAEGLGSKAAAVAQLDGIEKDRILRREGVGLTASELYRETDGLYGSESYIRRWRKRERLDRLGREIQDDRQDDRGDH